MFALVLLVAVVAYRSLFIAPALEAKYQRRCDAVFDRLSLTDSSGDSWIHGFSAKENGIEQLANDLRAIEVYLQRLIVMNPQNGTAFLQAAKNSERKSKVQILQAIQAEKRKSFKEAARFQSLAEREAAVAADRFERLAVSSLPEAPIALTWKISNRLGRSIQDPKSYDLLEADVLHVLSKIPDDDEATLRLGQLHLLRGYDLALPQSLSKRRDHIAQGNALIEKVKSTSIVVKTIKAESLNSTDDPSKAEPLTQEVLQDYWRSSEVTQRNPEVIQSMFTCLVRNGNIDEAVSFLKSHLQLLSANNQVELIRMCNAAIWRQMLCYVHFPNVNRRTTLHALFKLTASLEPDSSSMQILIDEALNSSGNADFLEILSTALLEDISTGYSSYIMAIQTALKGDWKASIDGLEKGYRENPGLAFPMAVAVSRVAVKNPSNGATAMRIHEQLTFIASKSFDVWLERIDLCIRQQQYSKAEELMDAIQPQIVGDVRRMDALVKRYLDIERSEKAALLRSDFIRNDKGNAASVDSRRSEK